MYSFLVIDVTDENRVENIDYVNVVSVELFDNYSDACAKCDEMIDKHIKEYGAEEDNEEEYYHSLYTDNERLYRNVLITFEDTRQFIVVKTN